MASRTARTRYALALEILLKGRMAKLVVERDFELLKEVAHLAQNDAPEELAVTDPALFTTWRAAVTRYHLAGWTNMTPKRVAEVTEEVVGNARAMSEESELSLGGTDPSVN